MDSRKTLSNRLDDNSVEDILINLPVKSLMRFKCLHLSRARQHPQLLISKWRGDSWVIYSPKDGFKGGEAVRKVTLPWCMDKNVTCSIDGLFCVIDDSISSTLIYNLATQQASPWAKTSITLRLDPSEPPTYGFGFDPQTKNYKAVCVWEKPSKSLLSLDVELFCEVFTVGENQWKKIDEVPPVRLYESAGVYANGSVYWRNAGVSDSTPPDSELIVAFDVGSE
ncbi:hypothetical protein MKW94_029928, partial [Papaver nudicaule]|nr:hypothetical protein [Papaver nudicaule]